MTLIAQDKIATNTQGKALELKKTPPFYSGDYVECRGWRGVLEDATNPLGPSGKERLILRDCYGIGYFHDPVSDLVYASPRMSQESLIKAYQEPGAHIDTREFKNFNRSKWESKRDRTFIVSNLKVNLAKQCLGKGDSIIDVGCHVGFFVMLAREAGYECDGIDVSSDSVRVGVEDLNIHGLRATTIEDAAIADCSYDGVVIWDVLEHVYNLSEVMNHCKRILKPGGYFFAHVPNHRGLSNRLKTLRSKIGFRNGEYHCFGFPWHLYNFSSKSLCTLVESVGMQPIRTASFSHRSKNGKENKGLTGTLNQWIEGRALSDNLYIVAQKVQ